MRATHWVFLLMMGAFVLGAAPRAAAASIPTTEQLANGCRAADQRIDRRAEKAQDARDAVIAGARRAVAAIVAKRERLRTVEEAAFVVQAESEWLDGDGCGAALDPLRQSDPSLETKCRELTAAVVAQREGYDINPGEAFDLIPIDPEHPSGFQKSVVEYCDQSRALDAATRKDEAARKKERDLAYIELLRQENSPFRKQAAAAALLSSAFVGRAIEGTAALVADRAQAELALWLVTDFSKSLCPDDAGEPAQFDERVTLGAWFQETCEVATNAGEQPSGMLASAFRKDIEELPFHVLVDAFVWVGGSREDGRAVGKVALKVVKELRDGEPLRDALAAAVASEDLRCGVDEPASCMLATAAIVIEEADDVVGSDGRLTYDDLLALLVQTRLFERLSTAIAEPLAQRDPGAPAPVIPAELRELVEALERAKPLVGPDGKPKPEAILFVADALVGFSQLRELYEAAGRLQVAMAAGSLDEPRRTAIFLASIDLVMEVADVAYHDELASAKELAPLVAAAIASARHFAKEEWPDGGRQALKMLVALRELLATQGKREPAHKQRRKATEEALRVTIRSLTFIVDAAAAETPADFEAALESASAPLGGWRRKTERFTTSLGAMAGLGGGLDVVLEGDGNAPVGYFVAPRAMLGLDLAGPVFKQRKRRSSFGMFVSMLDVGQLASQRIGGDAEDDLGMDAGVSEKPNVGIVQVFSPGLHLRLGMAETPVTLLVGASCVPDLREVKDTAGAPSFDAWVIQPGVALVVDVTLFPFGGRLRRR